MTTTASSRLGDRPPGVEKVVAVLEAAANEARLAGRVDLAQHLGQQQDRLRSDVCHILVAGEFKKGKSALINALVGVPVCSADALASTAIPTVVRYGATACAVLLSEAAPTDTTQTRRTPVPLLDAPRYAAAGVDDAGGALSAVEVALPRALLAKGIVLIDTPGVGGGFAAAHAAATLRALSVADAVLLVSDASQEYTAPEIEFLRRTAELCPNVIGVLTKIDLYSEWRRILDIDRGHLSRAGLRMGIVPVSCTLRELAVTTGDTALNNESGFPILVDRVLHQLLARRSVGVARGAVSAARSALSQVAGNLATEERTLAGGEGPGEVARDLEDVERRADRLSGPGARWQLVLQDRFADVQSALDTDLTARIRRLRQDAASKVKVSDPTRSWADIEPWLYERTNTELTAHHALMLAGVEDVARDVATHFEIELTDLTMQRDLLRPIAEGDTPGMETMRAQRATWLQVGMHAARGWSLSSSVITTIVVATLAPPIGVTVAVTAFLGAVFAGQTVRSLREAHLEAARTEAARLIGAYLDQARTDAAKASADGLRLGRQQVRDYFFERATEVREGARRDRQAATRAAAADRPTANRRVAQTRTDLQRIATLLERLQGVEAAVDRQVVRSAAHRAAG